MHINTDKQKLAEVAELPSAVIIGCLLFLLTRWYSDHIQQHTYITEIHPKVFNLERLFHSLLGHLTTESRVMKCRVLAKCHSASLIKLQISVSPSS